MLLVRLKPPSPPARTAFFGTTSTPSRMITRPLAYTPSALPSDGEHAAVADARVLVDDRTFDATVSSHAKMRPTFREIARQLQLRLVIISAHHNRVLENAAFTDVGSDPEHAVLQRRIRQDRAVANHDVIDVALVELRRRKIAILRVNRRRWLEEIERRQRLREREIRLEERPHGSDVLPVPLEDVGEQFLFPEQTRG